MNCDTVSQNDVSRSKQCRQRHHGDISNISARQDEPHNGSSSSNQQSSSYKLVSEHQGKDSEKCQSREVLLNLLQPPGSKVLHAQRSSCTLPYQDTEKISFNPDLHGSNCVRCTNVHQASRNPTNRRREMIEEWNQRAWYNSSMNSEGNGHKQNISTNRDATKGHFQDRETVVKFPCPREHLSKANTARTTSLPITVSCQSREAKKRPLYPEELQLHPDRCQNVPKDHQQYTSGQACFGKDNYTKDGKSAPLHKERQIEQNITMQVNRELPRKDVSQKRMYAPCWHFQSRHSLKNQHPISRQNFVHDHPEMGITSAINYTVIPNTDRIPYQLQRTPENEKDASGAVEQRIYRRPSSATQDDRMNHSISPSNNYRREMIYPSNEWGLSAVKLSNGPEICHGEKGFGKPSKSDSQALHHSTNESSQVTDIQSDECTPVIVQCYSLSTLTPTLESTPMANSQFTKFQNTGPSVNIDNGDGRVLPSHSRCSYQRHSPKSHKSASRPQSHEDFQYSSPAHRPASNTNRHHHNLIIQPKDSIDESSTSELADNDEQNPSGRAALSEHSHKRCTISSSLPCLTWHPEQQALRSGSDGRRDHNPHNNQWTEPQRKASQGDSNQETSHFPRGYQGTRSSLDMHDGHESKETFPNWQTKNVQHGGRQALKIHDYYEERRILVEKVYQDIPGSEEDTKCHQNSTNPYERTRQLCQTNHYQANSAEAEALQTPVCDKAALQVCSHQRANAVGSRKRKSRQPRPQRLKAGDPTLARETYQHQSQHVEYRQEDFSRSEHHHRANSPYQPEPDASVSEDKRHKRTEVVRVHGNERTMYSYESVQQPTDPVQQESPTRRDYVLQRTSPKPEVCRNEFAQKTHLPWHTSFPGRVASEASGQKCEQFIEFPRNSHVVSRHELARHRQANCTISHEYQTNSYCQSKSPQKHFTYSNVTKRPFNDGRNDIVAQQHWHGPIWMRGPERHLETLEKIRPVYDSTHVNSSTRVFVSHSDPSQHIISSNEGITSQFKTGCDSRWNTPATYIHGEHQDNRFVHHAVSATGKAPNKTSETQPSSPGDNGCDFNHTVEDTVVSDKSFTSVEASVITDLESEPTEQDDASVSEDHSFFVHTREVLTNYTTPAVKEKRFVCRYCSKKFAHFSTLQNHLRTHTGDKPFQCNFCGRRFAQSGVLKAHLRTHTGDKPFACMYCGKLFAQSTTLTNHLRTHTGHKPYICDFCGKSFSQPSTLRKHELSHTKERPYPCKFCGKAFAQQSTLTNHMRSHTGQRPYKCHFCDKSFAQLSTLDRHLRLHSTVSLKPHRCQYCSKSFSYISNLASHMRNHEQELASSQ